MLQTPSNHPFVRRPLVQPQQADRPRSSARTRTLVVFAALIAGVVAALTIGGPDAIGNISLVDSGQPNGSGSLTVNGEAYSFTTEHCLITEDDFIATGSGSAGGAAFRISASISSIELAFGTTEELDEPTDGDLWLRSNEPPNWQSTTQTVTANASFVDPLDPQSRQFPGQLLLECPAEP